MLYSILLYLKEPQFPFSVMRTDTCDGTKFTFKYVNYLYIERERERERDRERERERRGFWYTLETNVSNFIIVWSIRSVLEKSFYVNHPKENELHGFLPNVVKKYSLLFPSHFLAIFDFSSIQDCSVFYTKLVAQTIVLT